jgi:hypothetical protein
LPDVESGLVFWVLTLDGHLHGRTLQELYAGFARRWRLFLRRLRHWADRRGIPGPGQAWLRTVEAHQSGVPHLNVMMHWPELAALQRSEQPLIDLVLMGKSRYWLRGELRDMAVAVGFGPRSSLELPRSGAERLASYAAKCAAYGDRVAGEVAKKSQLPVLAPKGLRRYSSGKGFLVPKRKNPLLTGTILQRRLSPEGDERILPLVWPKCPKAQEAVQQCIDAELARTHRDYDRGIRPGARISDYVASRERFSVLHSDDAQETGPPAPA